jgi:ankyrin repeat protein
MNITDTIEIINNDIEVWEKMKNDKLTENLFINISDNDRIFLTKVYRNDVRYIKKKCEFMKDRWTRKDLERYLLIIVMYVTNINTLILILDKINPKYLQIDMDKITDGRWNNCLMLACYRNSNIEIIKYLVEEMKMNVNHCNPLYLYPLILACSKNTNLEIIKYLIGKSRIPVTQYDKYGRNCLMAACYENTNIEIIKYLIEDVKMDITVNDYQGNNCLLLACYRNTSLVIIKYLIEDKKMNTSRNKHKMSYLTAACSTNSNLDIIKYLINDLQMDTNHITYDDYNCLLFACNSNNVEIVKYLIEDVGMDLNCVTKKSNNCLTIACIHNKNKHVIKYLIENTEVVLQLDKLIEQLLFDRFAELLSIFAECVMNNDIFNVFVKSLITHYNDNRIICIIKKSVNPILLNENICNFLDITYQFDDKCKYNNFCENVRKLKGGIHFGNFSQMNNKKDYVTNKINRNIIDFTEKPSILFQNNGLCYYGYRDIIYEKIHVLKDLNEYACDEPIILEANVPKYIMLMYIHSCYDGIFDINSINTSDFYQFLNLIDKYPTDYLSINSLEISLIQYMVLNNIPFNDEIKALCDRYRLKYMYLYINQRKVEKYIF